MATVRAGNRRAVPALVSPPRLVLSVEEWESKAPLGDVAIKSINAVKAAGETVPLPLKVCSFVAGI